jgi:hypothetical protein
MTSEALYGHLVEAFLRLAAERAERRICGSGGTTETRAPEPHGPARPSAGLDAAADPLPRVLPRAG